MQDFLAPRGFLDGLEEGVLFLDERRQVLQANQAAQRMFGVVDNSLAGRLCPSLFAGTACARVCEGRGSCSLMPAHDESNKIQDVVLKGPDGGDLALRMWAMLLAPNDAGHHCAIFLRDCSHEQALERQVRDRWQLGGLTGRSAIMQRLYDQVLRAAASEASVLVTGESGVGKELVARALHDNSPRAAGPFLAVHCASLSDSLLESELFGHAKGAFSGAATARVGRFEAASGGTLLLDEIGEISPVTQTKLLRVLQEREVVRVGENHPRKVDVRVVAATHRDLARMVAQGAFREDLYYRLRVLPLQVPALREHREDIALLARKLLIDLAERYRRPDLSLSPEALALLECCDWPGNVRHLFNALEYAVVQAQGVTIRPSHLPPEVQAQPTAPPSTPAPAPAPRDMPAGDVRGAPQAPARYYRAAGDAPAEQAHIHQVLQQAGGNRAEAARRLGMSRTTLWKRLNAAAPQTFEAP